MRVALVLAGLTAIVTAAPHAQLDPSDIPVSISATIPTSTLWLVPSTSLNIPVTLSTLLPTGLQCNFSTTRTTKRPGGGHSEPIPIFSRHCDCPLLATVAYPCYATDALARCNFEENHSWVCWTSAGFGCPSPTRTCSNLFSPTPITGKHPCELGRATLPTITPVAIRY
ncbi:hypothetical protein K504DRAFT_366514 [Pleomassaria siparia CBS 279.74]|uniref:Uncharacterized protein n=1 Tax=Pleomassaria siparia CBS 279.74 TaxID=1314801 RepID=A0A6G1KPJ6_9PLEO|nr:hypothetical protein K504DRAFT_366514 [Pleomassaria siparia CBS 279.74]